MKKIASLWSGGLDSTISTYYFASKGYTIQPYHILIRNGSGKDAREREALDNVFNFLKGKFPNVLPVIRVKHKISPSDHRNEDLINFVKDKYNVKKVILGNHITTRDVSDDFRDDLHWKSLEQKTGVEVHDLTRIGYKTKKEQFEIGVKLLGIDVLKKTWSCQIWFKKPCGNCFSCKERNELFDTYSDKKDEVISKNKSNLKLIPENIKDDGMNFIINHTYNTNMIDEIKERKKILKKQGYFVRTRRYEPDVVIYIKPKLK